MRINSNRSEVIITATPASPVAKSAAPKTIDATSTLGIAKQALQAGPEIDMAKVQEIRNALLRGEIHFDADKVAGLMQKYHGGLA
ncbi:flagellar biosynthesis anti-sigma factor FlgM [Iodobacter arcticus]|uniref:Negative regulator of flagellin synthesis n=1 Tax=Iodobacter arcticus TaxID=590593 RepID=A0ABW2QUN5_9NEIS